MKHLLPLVMALIGIGATAAEPVARTVEYRHDGAVLEGVVVADPAATGRRPGVLLVHGAGPASVSARAKARHFALQGYVVFSADLFGKGASPKDTAEAVSRLKLNGNDRTFVRQRILAAHAAFGRVAGVDPKRMAAVGYGVGGTAVLEFARAKGDVEGVVCIHGDIQPRGNDGKSVAASILLIVGADDPTTPLTHVSAFEEEMRSGGVDWQLVRLGGVAGDFTNPQAGRNLASGRAYDADADQRSNELVRLFLLELFPAAKAPVAAPVPRNVPRGIPEKALKVLEHVDRNGEAMNGYEGGRNFGNFERRLPQSDKQGKRIRYREWDVNPLRPGVNRGAERLVTGSDGSAYYTDDHYESFKKIR